MAWAGNAGRRRMAVWRMSHIGNIGVSGLPETGAGDYLDQFTFPWKSPHSGLYWGIQMESNLLARFTRSLSVLRPQITQ